MKGQTCLNEWEFIKTNIERSTIKRYPYKQLLGISLTNYILQCKKQGLSSHETIRKIINENDIMLYMMDNEHEAQKLYDNIKISVCARFSEERTRGRI